jgi:RNA polymerase sigma factor (sigma-70 family)
VTRRATTRRPTLTKGQHVDPVLLDRLLDVPNERWEKNLKRLVREFRTKRIRLDLPPSNLTTLQLGTDLSWTSVYESTIQQLPRMDRADEFAMARRYEFVRARAADALAAVGFEDEEVARILAPLQPNTFDAARRGVDADYARICLDDLDRLRNVYVEGALYIVLGLAFRYRGLGVEEADLIQEGNASLFQAIDGFDWRRDVRFKTYAQYWVHQAVLKTLYNASRTVRVPIWVQKAYRKIQKAQRQLQDSATGHVTIERIAEAVEMTPERVEEILAVRRHAVSLDARIGDGDDDMSLAGLLADPEAEPVPDQIEDGDLRGRIEEIMADLPERERMILQRRFGLDGREPETLADIAVRLGVTAERVRQLQKAAISRLQKPRKLARIQSFA